MQAICAVAIDCGTMISMQPTWAPPQLLFWAIEKQHIIFTNTCTY